MLNFLGIGAQKCGTTWLFETLSSHPQIAFPGGKEVHYWDKPAGRSEQWYFGLFGNNEQRNGDITPAYGFLTPTVIARIYSLAPQLRLIYLIRDPMERAWSGARMALARAEMTDEDATDAWFIDHFKSKGSLARGDYQNCIQQWRSIYPSNQLLILRLEAIRQRPVQAANRVLRHLGLEDFFKPEHTESLTKKIFEGDATPIRPSLQPVLRDIYADKIVALDYYLANEPSFV
jgi:hypothetical protein